MSPFHRLKCRMYEQGITQKYLAQKKGVSLCYISRRFTGATPWEIGNVYELCDVLKIPYTEIPEYFPKNEVVERRS